MVCRFYPPVMASGRYANTKKSLLLVTLMILMTQVGYLENLNPWISGEEALDSNDAVAQSSAGTSVMYGNNTIWSPPGIQEWAIGDEMMAVTSDVVFYLGDNHCLVAYNAANMTRWVPNIAGRSNTCSSATQVGYSSLHFNFITQIDGMTYFTMKDSTGYSQIHAYNPVNDTVYLHDNSRSGGHVTESVALGRTIYSTASTNGWIMQAYNIDNGSSWDISTSGQSFSSLNVVGDKILALDNNTQQPDSSSPNHCSVTDSCKEPWVYDPANNTWFRPTRGNEIINMGVSSSDSKALVTNGQMFWVDANSTHGIKAWVFDSSNNTYWMLDDEATSIELIRTLKSPAVRSGTTIYYLARTLYSTSPNLMGLDMWAYDTVNASNWHLSNITELHQPSSSYGHRANLAQLASGDFVMNFEASPSNKIVFYSLTNDTAWEVSGISAPSDSSYNYSGGLNIAAVYGNTVYMVGRDNSQGGAYGVMAYDTTNGSTYSAAITGRDYMGTTGNKAVLATGNQLAFTMGGYYASNPSWADSTRYTFAVWKPTAVTVSDAWNITPGQRIDGPATGGLGGASNPGIGVQNLTASVEGADLSIDVPMTNITFQYNAGAASGSGSGSGASQSSFVNNIGLRSTSGSATQSTGGSAITPIEFSLEWDNFTTPSSLSSSETAMFPFDHSVNDTTSTPVENSTLSASNLTYDRHGREMHALDENAVYDANLSELAIASNRISLSLWIKPTNVGTEQSIIDNHPQYHLRMNTDGSLTVSYTHLTLPTICSV